MYVIFADTDCEITPEIAKEYGYNLISMPYSIDEKEVYPYEDFDVFDYRGFYALLRAGVTPKTSGISPEKYMNYFEPFFKEGKDILYVHFSAAMSGTFSAMNIAYEELKTKYPERKLYLLDTKAISVCSLNILKEVGDMYLQGKTPEEILKWGETEVDKFAVYFFAEDLSFFKRSGRVSGIAAFMGNLLGIKPIIFMDSDGTMKSVDKARGRRGVLAKILNYVEDLQEDIAAHRVIVTHADAEESAKLLGEMLEEKYPGLKVEYAVVNPTAGSHCGPDCVGVTFHAKHR
ncbi:MAG: DegV family protein [Clostridia bacterium]|nr:DegV family protein [Clostridia bacterium]